jgi:DNA-binding transcriptional ArsR family regulator
MPDTSNPPPAAPLPLEKVLTAIGSPIRWRILQQLAAGEQLMVAEIAERIGQSADNTSKQLAVLRDVGVVTAGRNRLYQLQPQFIADKTERLLDFGWCLLRMNAGK